MTIEAAGPPAATGHALSVSAVGEVVGSDGLAYDVADKDNLPTGVTAAGMVAYKSGSNGLVIALADETSTMDWDTANGASGAAAHTPAVSGYSWVLPSLNQWNTMFSANGGDEYSCSGLDTALATAGGEALTNYGSYWTSSVVQEMAYCMMASDGNAFFMADNKSNTYRVRACLAF